MDRKDNKPGSSSISSALEQIGLHDHLCLIYATQEEQFASAIPFLRKGLERDEKCLYIADENNASVVLKAMRAQGIDVDSAMDRGALAVLTKRESYLKQGHFDPDWMIDFLTESTQEVQAAGFSGLRATGCLGDPQGTGSRWFDRV